MHFFALFLFFAFGVMGLTMLGERLYRRLREGRAFVSLGWGVGLAWLANSSMWSGWAIGGLRYDWVGVTVTGLALGGSALLLHGVLGFFAGLHRKFDDQAEQLERSEPELRRIA
ncbi:MAG: hypothetical protein M0Z82_02720 [Actinomycetota bacterium]|jgi:hypothetical protein|nr:hypothetical protein [Actinomycetota bacterium]